MSTKAAYSTEFPITEWDTFEGVTRGYTADGDEVIEISERVTPSAWNGHQSSNVRGWAVWDSERNLITGEADGLRAAKKAAVAALRAATSEKEAPAPFKQDTNGRPIAAGDTVVWETEDGRSHHAGHVSERQDNDDIDVRVRPLGSAGDTHVVIKARRLRIAKVGNEGKYTVADLVDMADALENPPSEVVAVSRMTSEDDLTVSEAPAAVSGPKFEVMSAAHHRNGVSGRGFYVGIVKHWGDLPEGAEPRLLQVIAVPEDDAPEDVLKITFDSGSGVEIYVTDLMVIAKQGTVAFGRNSFRGDHFYAEARAIIIQTRADWDNQMLRLPR